MKEPSSAFSDSRRVIRGSPGCRPPLGPETPRYGQRDTRGSAFPGSRPGGSSQPRGILHCFRFNVTTNLPNSQARPEALDDDRRQQRMATTLPVPGWAGGRKNVIEMGKTDLPEPREYYIL